MQSAKNKVAFVAHCLLNQNSKVRGGARCAGVYSPLVEILREQGWKIQQMPCPELAFTGLHRFWAVREQLETTAYRQHCRRLAVAVAGAIEVHVTSSDPGRGGRPEWPEGTDELSPGSGIFIEELAAELAGRGVPMPRATGITHQLPDHDPNAERGAIVELTGGRRGG